MNFEKKVNQLIGQPYSEKNHCYALVMQLLPNAPRVDFIADNIYKSIKQVEFSTAKYMLKKVHRYQNKDIILLGNRGMYHHVGVYYKGGVIHSDIKRGVVYDDLRQLSKFFDCNKGLRL